MPKINLALDRHVKNSQVVNKIDKCCIKINCNKIDNQINGGHVDKDRQYKNSTCQISTFVLMYSILRNYSFANQQR